MASAGASPAQFDPEETLAQCARAMKGAHHVTIDAAAAQTFGCSIGKSLKRQFPSGPHRGKPADADVNDAARMLMWNAVRSWPSLSHKRISIWPRTASSKMCHACSRHSCADRRDKSDQLHQLINCCARVCMTVHAPKSALLTLMAREHVCACPQECTPHPDGSRECHRRSVRAAPHKRTRACVWLHVNSEEFECASPTRHAHCMSLPPLLKESECMTPLTPCRVTSVFDRPSINARHSNTREHSQMRH
jgi:hypothetical protein